MDYAVLPLRGFFETAELDFQVNGFAATLDRDVDFLTGAMLSDLEPQVIDCLLYTSPSPRDATLSRMPSSA